MFARAVAVAVVAAMWLLADQAGARGGPAPADGANVTLNRVLVAMIFAPPPASKLHPLVVLELLSPHASLDPQPEPSWLFSPAFAAIASRFTSAERLLHYRRGGVDANFWGVLNRGRGIRIRYAVRF